MEAGANPANIYQHLYERNSLGRLRLRGEVLARIDTKLDGRLAYTHILKDDFEKTGSLPSDTEDLVNMCLEIDGVESALIFVEQLGGGFKVSFRSRGVMDCSAMAKQFDGGGHKAAAGALVKGTLDEVQPRIVDAVCEAMSE